jgi:putative transposase
MTSPITKPDAVQPEDGAAGHLFETWFDPIEVGLRERVRGFIEEMIRAELDAALARPRYARRHHAAEHPDARSGMAGHRHGSRTRTLMGTFGPTEITVPAPGSTLPRAGPRSGRARRFAPTSAAPLRPTR